MKRLLANSILMASGILLSSQLYALGLGELTLDSALNQPLNASIELTDLNGLTEWEIKPSLASQADFDRAGVDRDFFLNSIKFKVESDKIKLTTKEAVNEPFLNFLLELNWPSGRVLREYTVLLDPPTYDEQNYQPLVASAQSEVQEVQLSEPAQPALVNSWDEPAASGSYKVQPNDTLWAIALETRPNNGVSAQQMMLAIQEENPDAFIGGNINRLKSHYVLNIPDEDRVRAISQQQAVAEVARQNQALNIGVAQVDATGLNNATTTKGLSSEGGEVRLITPRASDSQAQGAGGDAVVEGEGSRQELENDLAIALENADKNLRENSALRERLASLEEQITTLESLIAVKDDQLASLQAGTELAPDTSNEEEIASTDEAIAEDSEAAVDFNYTEETAEAEINDEAAAAAQAEEEARLAEERRARIAALMAEQEAEQQANSIVDELLEDPIIPAAAGAVLLLILLLVGRALKKRKENKVVDDEFAGLVADGDLLQDIDSSAESLENFDFELNDTEADASGADDWSDDFAEQEEAASSAADTVAQTEDALSEAEIYIAFGKFAQAAALLEGAIQEEPERSDLRLKLLEVHAENDDAESFYATETDLAKLGDAQADAEASKLRERLSNPIEAPITPSALGDDVDDFADLDNDLANELSDGLDFDAALDLSDEEVPSEEELDIPTLDDADLDFNLDDVSADNATESVEQPVEEVETDLEFDLDSLGTEVEDAAAVLDNDAGLAFDLGEPELAEAELADPETSEPELSDDFDLEFEVQDEEQAALESPVEDIQDEIDSGLDDLELILDADANEQADVPELTLDEQAADFDDFDLDFDINANDDANLEPEAEAEEVAAEVEAVPVATQAASSDDIDLDKLAEAEDEFAYLSGTDECATKLDLARAYIDMEDNEGAKELLQEVMQEGSEAQQAEARELISNL